VNDQTAAAWMIARVDTSPGRLALRLPPTRGHRTRPETIKRLLLCRCQNRALERPTRERRITDGGNVGDDGNTSRIVNAVLKHAGLRSNVRRRVPVQLDQPRNHNLPRAAVMKDLMTKSKTSSAQRTTEALSYGTPVTRQAAASDGDVVGVAVAAAGGRRIPVRHKIRLSQDRTAYDGGR
jgi:hypothetical protein